MKSVLQDWVMELGLRHQGVLMTAVRGCDTVPKEDISKKIIRAYRGMVLNSFDEKPSSFIEHIPDKELRDCMKQLISNIDHYPIHYIMHLLHASEIVAYKCPDSDDADNWLWFYCSLCHGFHMNSETEKQMDARLGADEKTFEKNSKITY